MLTEDALPGVPDDQEDRRHVLVELDHLSAEGRNEVRKPATVSSEP